MLEQTMVDLTQTERYHVVADCWAITDGTDPDRTDDYYRGRYEIRRDDGLEERYMVEQLGLVYSPGGTSVGRIADLPTFDDAVSIMCRWIQLDGWTDRGQDLAHTIRNWEPARRLTGLLDPEAYPPIWAPRTFATDLRWGARERTEMQRLTDSVDELPMVRQLDLIREIMFKLPENERQRWLASLTNYRTTREALLGGADAR